MIQKSNRCGTSPLLQKAVVSQGPRLPAHADRSNIFKSESELRQNQLELNNQGLLGVVIIASLDMDPSLMRKKNPKKTV